MHLIFVQAAIIGRVGFVAGLFKPLFLKGVLIKKQDAAVSQIGNIGDQSSRIHRYKRIDGIAWRKDFIAREMNLKTADARASAAQGHEFRLGSRGTWQCRFPTAPRY